MGSVNYVVVDVSSDEEEVDTHKRVENLEIDYSNWLTDVMEPENSDSTDVVEVLSEVKGGIDSQYRKPNLSIQALDDDDDDCVILDGDPDKPMKTASADDDDGKLANNDDDDNDVLVVGQKGEIACRDFPHPRHSCAKYAFSSTSHEKYCDMCHCYVCDIRAPCPYWCIGVSSINHCHANDKEKIWKNQREYFRTGYMPTPPSSKTTTNLLRSSQGTLSRNQVGIRPCSSSTQVADSSHVRVRHRIRKSISQNQGLLNRTSVRNSVIQKDRSAYRFSLRTRVASTLGNGNSVRGGRYRNAQVSQSSLHSSSVVAPTVNPEIYTQQSNYQSKVSDHCTELPSSQSNMYTRHSDQNICGSGNSQLQTNMDLFVPPEVPLTAADSQTETVQQQPGTNENVLETKLSEFESWLMDNSNQAGPVSPLPEPVSEDYVGALTFDFETFLND